MADQHERNTGTFRASPQFPSEGSNEVVQLQVELPALPGVKRELPPFEDDGRRVLRYWTGSLGDAEDLASGRWVDLPVTLVHQAQQVTVDTLADTYDRAAPGFGVVAQLVVPDPAPVPDPTLEMIPSPAVTDHFVARFAQGSGPVSTPIEGGMQRYLCTLVRVFETPASGTQVRVDVYVHFAWNDPSFDGVSLGWRGYDAADGQLPAETPSKVNQPGHTWAGGTIDGQSKQLVEAHFDESPSRNEPMRRLSCSNVYDVEQVGSARWSAQGPRSTLD